MLLVQGRHNYTRLPEVCDGQSVSGSLGVVQFVGFAADQRELR